MLSHMLSKKLFWLASRTGLAVYSRFPMFGPLNAALGVMRREDTLLVIERNDGRGVSFPGGIQLPWEKPEQALLRETREETGLQVTKLVLKLRYYSSADVPVNLTVFEMEAEGQLRSSWEGIPCWLAISEVRQRLIPSQRPIVESLCQNSD
jgi:8-oxo-dGTP pyrophosphatase MutT (NUDIX family)